MRVWCGKAGEFRNEDHGSVAGLLRRGGEEASKQGPRVSGRSALGAAERGERAGLRGWLAGPAGRVRAGPRGPCGGKRAWAAFGWADREGRAG